MLQGPCLEGGTGGPAAWHTAGEGENERRMWMREEEKEEERTKAEALTGCMRVIETGWTS